MTPQPFRIGTHTLLAVAAFAGNVPNRDTARSRPRDAGRETQAAAPTRQRTCSGSRPPRHAPRTAPNSYQKCGPIRGGRRVSPRARGQRSPSSLGARGPAAAGRSRDLRAMPAAWRHASRPITARGIRPRPCNGRCSSGKGRQPPWRAASCTGECPAHAGHRGGWIAASGSLPRRALRAARKAESLTRRRDTPAKRRARPAQPAPTKHPRNVAAQASTHQRRPAREKMPTDYSVAGHRLSSNTPGEHSA